jgi:molybdopterin/thiamine biosynthesis adenylyltransferase/rhodanese-related sulfurtransferase
MSDRYSRQTVLSEVGEQGQARLAASTVLVVGAGGLGCAVLSYLVAAGVGRLVIVDPDRVEESNLHRQPLYRMEDLTQMKVLAARRALLELNPEVQIEAVAEALTPANAAALIANADLAVDAADSFAVTYTLSDECWRQRKALITASVLGLSGYVGVFCAGSPSYRAVFPEMPPQAGSCSQSGVLGTAVGVMGSLQAHLVLAVLLHLNPAVLGHMTTVDFKAMRFGSFSFEGAPEPEGTVLRFIAPSQVAQSDVIIDLRGLVEAPVSPFATALRLKVDDLEQSEVPLPQDERIVLCCRTGVRAWRAARALQHRGYRKLALVAFG